MANVIGSMLVGVGVEFDKKSADQVNSGLGSIKSKALQLGAVLGGAFGLNALTNGFANAADEIGKFSEVYGVAAQDVKALGGVFELQGGTLQNAMGQLTSIAQLRAGLLSGDAGFIEQFSLAGLDSDPVIRASNAYEALLEIARQFSQLDEARRINAARILGFDDATVRVLGAGRQEIQDQVLAQKELFTLTDEMTQKAADFNDEWQKSKTRIQGVGAAISNEILLPLTKALNSFDVLDQKQAEKGIRGAGNTVADTFIDAVAGFVPGAKGDEARFIQEQEAFVSGGGIAEGLAETRRLQAVNRRRQELLDQGLPIEDIRALERRPVSQPSAGPSLIPSEFDNPANRDIVVTSNLVLDGSVIDRRVVRVNETANGEALQNLTSTTNR